MTEEERKAEEQEVSCEALWEATQGRSEVISDGAEASVETGTADGADASGEARAENVDAAEQASPEKKPEAPSTGLEESGNESRELEPEPACAPASGADGEKRLERMEEKLESMGKTGERLFSEVREMSRLYHQEFAGRLRKMQNELEEYRAIERGQAFDGILAAIAEIYVNYETLADDIEEPKAKERVSYMLADIEDLLAEYKVERRRSEIGEKRDLRHCKVMKRVATDDPAKHGTVARSYGSGFHEGNRTIRAELVDIFICEKKGSAEPTAENDVDADKRSAE